MESSKQSAALCAAPILAALSEVMLEEGISYSEFAELAKQAFVTAAEQVLRSEKKVSDSRIAILTGMHRKDIKRLREMELTTLSPERAKTNRSTAVISAWTREAQYLDENGGPKILAFDGATPCLTQLIHEFSGDMPARAVRDELERMCVIEKVADGWKLRLPSYIPDKSKAAILDLLGSDTTDLIHTIHHNIKADKNDKYFQRKVEYDQLAPSTVEDFGQFAAEDSLDLLKRFDRWLAKREKADKKKRSAVSNTPVMRAGVGIYFFSEQRPNNNIVGEQP